MNCINYFPNFVENPTQIFEELVQDLAWVRRDTVPRSEYYINKFGVPYTYGRGRGIREYAAQPNHEAIEKLSIKLKDKLGVDFEVCFLNRYHNQSDHLGWHSDDSPEMDDNRPIAIISLGVEREIWFSKKENDKPVGEVTKLKLENGSLCVMAPGMQDTHLHRIPKAGFVTQAERISLTFRGYVK